MCGIAGFAATQPVGSAGETVRRMTSAIAHRGPDADGHWVSDDARVALGHRRLSIIDLSPAGAQPMQSRSGRFVTAFNGEIYNFEALREKLPQLPYRGHSDTEVLLEYVEAFGLEAFLRDANGMFGLALYDRQGQKVHLARDRFGEKPLYYALVADGLVFGSELKALLPKLDASARAVDRDAVYDFIKYGYVPAPKTIYQGVRKLQPGHALTWSLDEGQAAGRVHGPWPYYDVLARQLAVASASTGGSSSDSERLEELERLLSDAVRLRTFADVPVGCFLSGGIDSSLISALMQKQARGPIKTFSIGFAEAEYNEAPFAKKIAEHLGTDHTELYLSAQDSLGLVEKIPELFDEPFGDSSQLPTYLVSSLARRHVTVTLSGDAGDELFGGYNRYVWSTRLLSRLGSIPEWALQAVGAMTRGPLGAAMVGVQGFLPGGLRVSNPRGKMEKLRSVLAGRRPGSLPQIYDALVSQTARPDLLMAESQLPRMSSVLSQIPETVDPAQRLMFADLVTYLPDDILVKVDRAGMGVALENRIPFLDPRVVEFASGLPMGFKVRQGKTKWILRELLARHVPRGLFERPKMGFGVPVAQWLRGELKGMLQDLLSKDRLERQGILNPVEVERLVREHVSGQVDHHAVLWNLLVLQMWWDRWAA